MPYRIVFAISGASGMLLAKTILEAFASISDLEVYGIVSENSQQVLNAECEAEANYFAGLTKELFDPRDMSIGPASGSWQHDGMIVCPCSMSTLACIANGCGRNSIHRAADVTLKENRPLILAPREAPLSRIHLRNMLAASEAGALIFPFMPAFYKGQLSIEMMMRYYAGRILDQLRIPHTLISRWRDDK
ncbi:MAG: UbiX family flavin prenyltransferase [Desulfovibrionaceae bacterium]|nr:UbiX family flavin prenyltransferase [Desulfovibrionaceae bacterium]